MTPPPPPPRAHSRKNAGSFCKIQTHASCPSACDHDLFCQQVPLSTRNYRQGLGRCCSSQASQVASCGEGCNEVVGADGCVTGCTCLTPPPTAAAAVTTPEAAVTLPAGTRTTAAPGAGDGAPGDVGADAATTAPSDPSASVDGDGGDIDGVMIAVFAVLVVASAVLLLALLRNRKKRSNGEYRFPTAQIGAAPGSPDPENTVVANRTFSETSFGSGSGSGGSAGVPAAPAATGTPSNKVVLTEDGFEPAFEQQRPAAAAPPSPKSVVLSEDGFGEGRGRQMLIGTSTRRQAGTGSNGNSNAKTFDSEWAGGGIEGYVDISGDRHATWNPEYYENPDETEA